MLKYKIGHCWDQVELERAWFKKHNYEYKTLFIYFESDLAPYICHTYLVYNDKKNNTWNWFEHADENNKGIHKLINESNREYLMWCVCWREAVLQQYLGKHKCAAPDGHR